MAYAAIIGASREDKAFFEHELKGDKLAALQHMPNVILTDHNAYNTTGAIRRIDKTTADNIRHFLSGKEVFTV